MSQTTAELTWAPLDKVPTAAPAQGTKPEKPEPVFRPPVAILGIPFDVLDLAEATALIEQMIASRRPYQLVTANLDFLVQALRDVELRRILLEAHLVLCDGTPLVWASRLFGNALPGRVAGADLVPHLLHVAAQKGYRPFFLGGAPEVAAQAMANLKARFPTLKIAGCYSPPVRRLLEMDHAQITRRIRAAEPDILFVSFGCPKAEKWVAMHYRALGVPVAVGVGATIDFLAGRVNRAPVWMQRGGVEWIFRLLQEPRRLLGRYVTDLWYFARKIPAQWLHLQCRGRVHRLFGRASPSRRATKPLRECSLPGSSRRVGIRPTDAPLNSTAVLFGSLVIIEPLWLRLRIPPHLNKAFARQVILMRREVAGRHCLLELDGVKFIDSSGVGLIVWLRKQLRAGQRELVLLAPSKCVRRALRWSQLEDFFLIAADAAEARRLIEERAQPPPAISRVSFQGLTQPLVWQGEITASNAEQFWERIQTRLCGLNGHQTKLAVDLSELQFIDSTGLGLLLRAKKEATQRCVELHFVNAHPNVRNVMRMAQIDGLLLASS